MEGKHAHRNENYDQDECSPGCWIFKDVIQLADKDLDHKEQHPYCEKHHSDPYELYMRDFVMRVKPKYEHIVYSVLAEYINVH